MAEKLYYSMGEVAEMFDVRPSLLRHWESQFSVLRPKRNKKGNRLFTAQDVENLKLIYHLVKERGMTLEGAKKVLRGNRGGTGLSRDAELMERLQRIRALLLEVREDLKTDDEDILPEDGLMEMPAEEEAAAATVPATAVAEVAAIAEEIEPAEDATPTDDTAVEEISIEEEALAAATESAAEEFSDAFDLAPETEFVEIPSEQEVPAEEEAADIATPDALAEEIGETPEIEEVEELAESQETGEIEAPAEIEIIEFPAPAEEAEAGDTAAAQAGEPQLRRTRRRRKKEEGQEKELFAYFEQSLF